MRSLETIQTREVARPLKVLAPLIQDDISRGDQAGIEFYRAAGEKLAEAEDGHFDGDSKGFYRWAEKEFGKKPTTIDTWVALAAARGRNSFKSLRQFRQAPKEEGGFGKKDNKPAYREWTAPVDAIADKARIEQRRLIASEHVSRQEEREAKLKLKLRIIDIGYKVLARELHPDKVGGSKEAMTRLNEARNELKANA
jgi:hypothetical protein